MSALTYLLLHWFYGPCRALASFTLFQGCGAQVEVVESESEGILGGVGRNLRWSRSRKEF
jgi:hypothetical protein